MSAFFSTADVNTGRQTELDLLKVLTIFNMIFMHLQEIVFSFSYNDRMFVQNTWGLLFCCNAAYLAGPFSFLFSMGCTIPFSRNNAPQMNMRRGAGLLGIWLILNILRAIPVALKGMVFEEIPFQTSLFRYIFANDVLFFAGVFFLFFGSLQKLKFSYRKMLLIFGAMFLAAQLIGDFGRFLPERTFLWLSGFVWIGHYSAFPLLNWGMIVMLGVAGGCLLKRCLDRKKLYVLLGISGVVAVTVMSVFLSRAGALKTDVLLRTVGDPLSIHRANVLSVTCALGCLAWFLGFCRLVCLVLPEKVKKGISLVAGKILRIYIAHWMILPWLAFMPWLHAGRAGVGKLFLVTGTVYLVSFVLVLGYEFLIRKFFRPAKNPASPVSSR